MSAWETVVVVAALLSVLLVFLAGLLLLALFVRQAAFALIALREVREQTNEADQRRETVDAAREAVEDVRSFRDAFGGSTDAQIMDALRMEAEMNGKPFSTVVNEQRNAPEEEPLFEPSVPSDTFYVPSSEQ